MEITDFLRCANEEMNKFEKEFPTKGLEPCKNYLNFAGRDIVFAETLEAPNTKFREEYLQVKERLQKLRRTAFYQ